MYHAAIYKMFLIPLVMMLSNAMMMVQCLEFLSQFKFLNTSVHPAGEHILRYNCLLYAANEHILNFTTTFFCPWPCISCFQFLIMTVLQLLHFCMNFTLIYHSDMEFCKTYKKLQIWVTGILMEWWGSWDTCTN